MFQMEYRFCLHKVERHTLAKQRFSGFTNVGLVIEFIAAYNTNLCLYSQFLETMIQRSIPLRCAESIRGH